jgi:hypothetical protein
MPLLVHQSFYSLLGQPSDPRTWFAANQRGVFALAEQGLPAPSEWAGRCVPPRYDQPAPTRVLRTLKPGERMIDGDVYYSSAFLNEGLE